MRCRALAAIALVGLFSASVDTSLADALISTPLCDSLIRSAASTIGPITLDDNALRLPFQCQRKIVQYLSLCCMTILSSHRSIASAWSNNVEFKDLVLRLLSEGHPDIKPHVITLLFYVGRTCPNFIQKLFDDESKVGPQAIGSALRGILDFLDDYSQRLAILQQIIHIVSLKLNQFPAFEKNWQTKVPHMQRSGMRKQTNSIPSLYRCNLSGIGAVLCRSLDKKDSCEALLDTDCLVPLMALPEHPISVSAPRSIVFMMKLSESNQHTARLFYRVLVFVGTQLPTRPTAAFLSREKRRVCNMIFSCFSLALLLIFRFRSSHGNALGWN